MLKYTFTVEVYIPKMIHGNILELMDSMCRQNEWISESKMRAVNKTISTLLLIWLEETLLHSRSKKRNNCHLRPKLTSMFTYQNPVTAVTYTATVQNNNGNIYRYRPLLNCDEWTRFIKDPFNKFVRDNFVNSSHQMKIPKVQKKLPPYSICWSSLTIDVGPVEKKRRIIDVRHVNGYLNIPGKCTSLAQNYRSVY